MTGRPRIRTDRVLRSGEIPPELPAVQGMSQQKLASDFKAELDAAMDVLLGRAPVQYDLGSSTLMEVSDAYFARSSEMEMFILGHERTGAVKKGDPLYRFRTGELRSFQELTKKSAELGSRRITMDQMRRQAEMTGTDTPRRGRGTTGE